jgi:hypothetical protein
MKDQGLGCEGWACGQGKQAQQDSRWH